MKLLLADPVSATQQRAAEIITDLEPRATLFRTSDATGFQRILTNHADLTLVIVDDAIVDGGDESIFALIRREAPDADIALTLAAVDRDRLLRAIHFGAVAVILKKGRPADIKTAYRQLLTGHCSYPRALIGEGPAAGKELSARNGFDLHKESLTPREFEVFEAIGRGFTVARIADALQLSPHTVRVHVTRIMKKLDLQDRASLFHYAIKRSAVGSDANDH